jgi:uncharacterized protein involved in exopolysaccharide biosynthesis
MTEDHSPASTATAPAPPAADSPLGRYQVRLRRQRIVYAAVLAAIVVVGAVVVAVAWSRHRR